MAFFQLHKFRVAKHRVEFLADGVFAIVMTLLVLELKVPELPRHASTAELAAALRHLGPTFFAFWVTFLLAGSYWFLHNLSMEFVKHADQKLSFINLGFLFFVTLFPFGAALLGHFLGNALAQAIYFLNQFGAAAFLMLNWRYARKADLLAPVEPDLEQKLIGHVRGLALGTLAGAIAAVVVPEWAFIAMLLAVVANRVVSRRLAAKASAEKPKPEEASAQ